MTVTIIILLLNLFPSNIWLTIDINAAELQYLADHLTPEECRKLVALVHFQSNVALDQAERKVPKDVTCLEHLYHWNSMEGRGQTHQVLEHKLRQIGKIELADWLGRTVFHQIGVDLDQSIRISSTTDDDNEDEDNRIVTVEPLVPQIENPLDYKWYDYLLYGFAVGLILTLMGLCLKLAFDGCKKKLKNRRKNKLEKYNYLENDSSGSENEENKFDIRTLISSSLVTR